MPAAARELAAFDKKAVPVRGHTVDWNRAVLTQDATGYGKDTQL
jgi:hypothetical protein